MTDRIEVIQYAVAEFSNGSLADAKNHLAVKTQGKDGVTLILSFPLKKSDSEVFSRIADQLEAQ